MTNQIKQNQVVPTQPVKKHPVQGPPRDVKIVTVENLKPVAGKTDPQAIVSSGNKNVIIPPPPQADPGSNVPVTIVQQPTLQTPLITSIKSQTVNYQGDGTAAIDVVITVSDIVGATEYDIRITKN
jgi:hypothetical protein